MIRLLAPITKIDVEKRLVIGRLAQEIPDRAGEILDYASSKPYFKNWSEGFAKATSAAGQEVSYGNLRAMHGKVAAGKFTRVDFNDEDKAIDVIAKVVDDQEWKKCEEGVYTAFSIGGDYVGPKRAEKIGGKTVQRYTANPGEGSLVDSPCIPTAKFFEVVKSDGTSFQKAFVHKELTVEEQNARVEKVARKLARKEFRKLAPDQQAALPLAVFEKMSPADQSLALAKRPADADWQAHILEAIRLIKSSNYDEDEEDLEKPDEVDQDEWDDMSYEEKLEAIDEYEKMRVAQLAKAEAEKDLVKPAELTDEAWAGMSTEAKQGAVKAAALAAADLRKKAALEKAEKEEMDADDDSDDGEAKKDKDGDDDADAEGEESDEEERAEQAAKAAGATESTLSAVDELAKMLDSGVVTPEALLNLAKGAPQAAEGVQKSAPTKVEEPTPVEKFSIPRFAAVLHGIAEVFNGDVEKKVVPDKLHDWLEKGALIFVAMDPAEFDGLIEASSAQAQAEKATRSLATMHKMDELRKQLEDPEISLRTFHKVAVDAVGEEAWKEGGYFQQYIEDRQACIDNIVTKAGARHSAADKEHLQQAHDHLCKLGAACSKEHLPEEEAEKLSNTGQLFKLALQSEERISNLEKQLKTSQEELEKVKSRPVQPKGVIRAISKGQDVADQAPREEKPAPVAKAGEHNEAAAIAAVADQVRKTAAFRQF